jgi:Ion channel
MFLFLLGLGSLMVVAAILIHYETLRMTATYLLPRASLVPRRAHVSLGVLACMAAHSIEIWAFALFYWLVGRSGIDIGFMDQERRSFLDFLYFSAESYTSLGYGDVRMMTAELRLLAGIEALTGLVLIAWSASFTYFLMAEYWREQREVHRRSAGDKG